MRDTRARQVQMMAWGAMGNSQEILREWARLARLPGPLELSSGDWFFLPASLWNRPEYWEILLQAVTKIRNLGLHSPCSLLQGPPELLERTPTTPWAQIHRYAIRFHLARTRGDQGELRRICNKFPRWRDPRWVLEWLQEKQIPPTHRDMIVMFGKGADPNST
jgi:hypothetical protein